MVSHAADKTSYEKPKKIMRSLKSKNTPIRVTEVPYIKRKHHEISSKLIENNPEVKTLSHCPACHTRAEQGSFDENEVRIPGFGSWDD